MYSNTLVYAYTFQRCIEEYPSRDCLVPKRKSGRRFYSVLVLTVNVLIFLFPLSFVNVVVNAIFTTGTFTDKI